MSTLHILTFSLLRGDLLFENGQQMFWFVFGLSSYEEPLKTHRRDSLTLKTILVLT